VKQNSPLYAGCFAFEASVQQASLFKAHNPLGSARGVFKQKSLFNCFGNDLFHIKTIKPF